MAVKSTVPFPSLVQLIDNHYQELVLQVPENDKIGSTEMPLAVDKLVIRDQCRELRFQSQLLAVGYPVRTTNTTATWG